MRSIAFGQWHLEADAESTAAVYAAVRARGPERCSCLYCENFRTARDEVFSPAVRELFDRFGIDPELEAEVFEYGGWPSAELRQYDGWFHFIGRIVSGPDKRIPEGAVGGITIGESDLSAVDERLKVRFTSGRDLCFEEFAPVDVVQLWFSALVPWVLAERPEGSRERAQRVVGRASRR